MTTAIHRVAVYARVSANGHGQDPEMQLRDLREYARRRRLIATSEVSVNVASLARIIGSISEVCLLTAT